jgi:hypothetical protein
VNTTHWHIRITLESSLKDLVQSWARAEERSDAYYIGRLIKQHAREKEKQP